jgi:ubiquinone/menaquinone biosynthesis C-methylase UbiE
VPAVYDKFAANYDRAFAPLERLGLRRWRQEVIELLPKDARILELGCGSGANFEFYPQCKLAVSSEISIGMLEIAAAKRRENHLIQADAQSLPFGEDEFDAAFATLVFCSIPDPMRAFAEIKRVLKPGGKLILLEHVRPSGILGPVFDAINVVSRAVADDHFNRETSKLAADAGLRIVEARKKLASIVNLIVAEVP